MTLIDPSVSRWAGNQRGGAERLDLITISSYSCFVLVSAGDFTNDLCTNQFKYVLIESLKRARKLLLCQIDIFNVATNSV